MEVLPVGVVDPDLALGLLQEEVQVLTAVLEDTHLA